MCVSRYCTVGLLAAEVQWGRSCAYVRDQPIASSNQLRPHCTPAASSPTLHSAVRGFGAKALVPDWVPGDMCMSAAVCIQVGSIFLLLRSALLCSLLVVWFGLMPSGQRAVQGSGPNYVCWGVHTRVPVPLRDRAAGAGGSSTVLSPLCVAYACLSLAARVRQPV